MSLETLAAQPARWWCTLPAMFHLTAFKAPLFHSQPCILGSTTKYTKKQPPIKIQRVPVHTSLPSGTTYPSWCCWRSGWLSPFWWFTKCHLWILMKHFVYLRLRFPSILGPAIEREKFRLIYLQNCKIWKSVGQDLDRSNIPTGPQEDPIPSLVTHPEAGIWKDFFFNSVKLLWS